VTVGPQEKGVSLETIANGAVVERFNDELLKVLENIQDPNTDATAARTITLKVTLKPSEDRDMAGVDISCTSKTAAPVTIGTKLFLGVGPQGAIATEYHPQQVRMNFDALAESAT
jgi:hypothetical protein